MNRSTLRPPVLLALLGLVAAGCSDRGDPVTPEGNGPPGPGVSFAADVQPVLTASCALAGCHAGSKPQAGMSLVAGDAPASIIDVTSTGYAPAKRVVPGDPAASVLYNKITDTGRFGGDMPPGPPALSANEIETIRVWIEEGAEDN